MFEVPSVRKDSNMSQDMFEIGPDSRTIQLQHGSSKSNATRTPEELDKHIPVQTFQDHAGSPSSLATREHAPPSDEHETSLVGAGTSTHHPHPAFGLSMSDALKRLDNSRQRRIVPDHTRLQDAFAEIAQRTKTAVEHFMKAKPTHGLSASNMTLASSDLLRVLVSGEQKDTRRAGIESLFGHEKATAALCFEVLASAAIFKWVFNDFDGSPPQLIDPIHSQGFTFFNECEY